MSAADVARRYFEAIAGRDLDAAVALWSPGGIERVVGQREVTAPDGVRELQNELRGAFPDLTWNVLDVIAGEGNQAAVRWRATGTFAGPGTFQGFVPNGAQLEMEGCDVLTIDAEERIERLDAYLDSGDVARQLGLLPPAGSKAEARLTRLANARTRAQAWIHGTDAERIAEGVWIVRGGVPMKTHNVYLLEDAGGVTLFDCGSADMAGALATAAARLGGITRIVLGHADCDHRGAAPALGAPVYCHPLEREAAESPEPYRDYFDRSKLDPRGRTVLWRLMASWDGGPVQIVGTVEEGDEIAGFKVVHLPGHAPGLIGLFREQDRLALVSDVVYTVDPQSGRKQPAHVPHPAFNQDTDQARASIRKLAGLDPASVWAGHTDPVTGDVAAQLERAATEPA